MSVLRRWCRFNLVGLVGMGVQLGTLAMLNRLWPAHALASSVLALEVTLVHNFLWHERYTWRDRRAQGRRLTRLWRFHISNGAVSLAATLLLIPIATRWLRVPLVAANFAVILLCSFANFFAGDRWTFASGRSSTKQTAAPDILERLPHLFCGPL